MNILVAGDLYIADNFKNQQLIDESVKNLFETAYCQSRNFVNRQCSKKQNNKNRIAPVQFS